MSVSKPRIRRLTFRSYGLVGLMDWSFLQWWECEGGGKNGIGATPKEAYEEWERCVPANGENSYSGLVFSTRSVFARFARALFR